MPDDNKIKNYSAADIEKYHKGLMSAKERHDLEKAALDDPFLADALEGYTTQGVNISEDVAELNKRLVEKTESSKVIPFAAKKNFAFTWWRVAAVIVLIAGAGFLVYQFAFNKKPKEIAENRPAEKNVTSAPDSFQNNIVQNPETSGSEKKPATKESKPKIKNEQKAAATNETAGPGMSRTKADTVIIQSLNTPPVTIAPSKDIVANQNSGVEELNKAAAAKKEMNNLAFNEKKSLNETVVVKKIPEKKIEIAKEGYANNENFFLDKTKSVKNNSFRTSLRNNVFTGRITDPDNNPLPFANITNTTDSVGTYTDAKGYFTLTSPDSVLNVRIQSLGFTNAVTQLRSDVSNNKVILHEDKNLDPLVLSKKKPNASRFGESNMKVQESEPADGWDNYDTYLANNLKIPETIQVKQQARGEVEVSFEVDNNGEPINIKVEKSLCTECDIEAIRLIKAGPKWVRHSKNGRTRVTVSF